MKTKRFILTYLSITFFSMFSIAQLKIDHERYKKLLNEGKYETLIDETMKIRSSSEYGKNWIIDYYIALGFCGAGKIDASDKGFNYIIKEYPENEKMSNLINASRNKCNNTGSTFDFNDFKNLFASNNWQGGGTEPSVVKGKLGYVLDCNKDVELYEFNPNFNQEELQKRLFKIDEIDSAVTYYKNYLPANKYNIYASGRFIFITPLNSSLSDKNIKNITDELEKTYAFYVDYYSLRPPDKLITVYLMGSSKRLAEVALETHGLKIPDNNYGYSCLADLSVLGNSSANIGLGTIRHELFHLIVRTDLGDIPGWLDEGIACLYEESHWEDNKLVCNDIVWRTAVLKFNNDVKNPLPAIRTIIENNWGEFTPNSAITICELSVNYAMAKHFMMYLDEKNMLPALVDSYKNRKNVFVNSSYSNESSISILQNTFGDLSQIQNEFDLWLKNNYNIKTARDRDELIERIRLYRELKIQCSNDKDVIDMNNEFEFLMGKLNEPKIVVQGELLDRCVKFIFRTEELVMKCKEWY